MEKVGKCFLGLCADIGAFIIFCFSVLSSGIKNSFNLRSFLEQLNNMFLKTLPLIAMTSIFTGAVLVLQSYTGFSRMNAESAIASVVAISVLRELGPVISGLMFAGRTGASIASEIGIMRVTEQIDALEMLGIKTKSYLLFPRIISGIISLTLLVVFADILGIFGGYIIATRTLDFDSSLYITRTLNFIESYDFFSGIIKAAFFGFAISVIGCYSGYCAKKGAYGVGSATTNGVVMSSIGLLILNYVITSIMFSK